MGTLTEKLQRTLASKQGIKQAIEKKGVTVGDIPLSEYASKIASIGTDDGWKESDWIDIQQVLATDTENYVYKSIYLLDDSKDTITLNGGIAYKTSDSDIVITNGEDYTFTGYGDVPCSKGYKTRWVIVYNNDLVAEHPTNIEKTLLWCIIDGMRSSVSLKFCYKLKYVDYIYPITEINANAFYKCKDLVYVSGLKNVTKVGNYAFAFCSSLNGCDLLDGYSIGTYAFYGCASINEFVFRNIKSAESSSFLYSNIKHLIFGNSTTTNAVFDGVDNLTIESSVIPQLGLFYPASTSNSTVYSLYKPVRIISGMPDVFTTLPSSAGSRIMFGDVVRTTTTNDFENNAFCENIIYEGNEAGAPYSTDMLKTVSYPNSISITGDYCFNNCTKLTTINAPYIESIEIANNSFVKLDSLKELNMPNLKTISKKGTASTFNLIEGLPIETIDLPELETLPYLKNVKMFSGLTELKSFNVPKITHAPNSFLSNCGLEEYTMPKTVKTTGSNVLSGSQNLKRFYFEEGWDGCAEIDLGAANDYLFCQMLYNCPNLEYIYIPASVTTDDVSVTSPSYHIAYNCPKLTTIEVGSGFKTTLYLKHLSNLTKECILNIFNSIADLTGGTAKKLFIATNIMDSLTDEEIAIATNKNWTIS